MTLKIEVEISDEMLEMMVLQLSEINEVEITVAELKKNSKLQDWFANDMEIVYFERFGEGLGDVDLAGDLGLE